MKSINEKINDMKTIEELDAFQNELNEKFDTRRRVLNLIAEAKELGGKSFGYLKESFENLSGKLFKTDEGKAVMRKYTNVIKENKSLSSLHKLYENIRKAHSGIDFDYFVGTICETNWNVKAKDFSDVKNVFQSWRIPMAANMQLVLWNSASAEPLVSLYLNESICPLPLEPVGTCFYKWSDFKSKYEK